MKDDYVPQLGPSQLLRKLFDSFLFVSVILSMVCPRYGHMICLLELPYYSNIESLKTKKQYVFT